MRVALKAAIFASGQSQRQIAAATGIPENRLSELVRGWADPREDERASLMTALRCPPAVFDRDAILEARRR
jgi:hypothetical protein